MNRATDVVTLTGDEYNSLLADAKRWRWTRERLVIRSHTGVWWLSEDAYRLGSTYLPLPATVDAAADALITEQEQRQ